jgi:phosphate transport system substrate-binding protein
MIKKSYQLIIAMIFFMQVLLGACSSQSETQNAESLTGTITTSGAFALYPMMQVWADEFSKVNPGVSFDISAGGAGKGMADTLAGAVDIGMVSRAISTEEEDQGAFWVAVTKDAVFAVINAQNPILKDISSKGMTQEILKAIYIDGSTTTWGQAINNPDITDEIHIYTRSDACGAADNWAKFLGAKQENLLGIGVSSDPGLLDAVVKDTLGIGYNNLNYVFDAATGKPVEGVVILPIDFNKNGQTDPEEILDTKDKAVEMVKSGQYPMPPARLEFLVTKGKPTGLVQAFIEWILTDGQKFVSDTGYIELTPEQLNESLEKIK